MKLETFALESWMTEHEKEYTYNLAESCVAALSIEDLLSYTNNAKEILDNLYKTKLDYGPIEGSKKLMLGILKLYDTGNYENLAICHGCISANEMVLTSLLDKEDHIITILPTYQQLYSLPQSYGVEVIFVRLQKEKGWIPEVNEFETLIKSNTKMICLTSPNNPTGTSFSKTLLEELVVLAKKYDLYIFIDEAYRGASISKEVAISDIYEKGISTGSMSKVFGLPGIRMGWIKGPTSLIKEINNRKDYHMISNGYIYDYLASIALEQYDKIHERTLRICEQNRQLIKDWIANEPLVSCVLPTTGTIAFLEYHIDMPSDELCIKLQKDTGVFFVPGSCFGIEHHLRFGMANDPEIIEEGLTIFSEWLHKQK
ncbi:MAG: aminotransferase class I/II-fold pyridoxal phosphate-dependent enzyme [Coprobacillaceae bacterium]